MTSRDADREAMEAARRIVAIDEGRGHEDAEDVGWIEIASVARALLASGKMRSALERARIVAQPPEKRYERLLKAFSELQEAAQHVVNETDRIHDGEPWPTRYRAPYGAITKLRILLNQQRGMK